MPLKRTGSIWWKAPRVLAAPSKTLALPSSPPLTVRSLHGWLRQPRRQPGSPPIAPLRRTSAALTTWLPTCSRHSISARRRSLANGEDAAPTRREAAPGGPTAKPGGRSAARGRRTVRSDAAEDAAPPTTAGKIARLRTLRAQSLLGGG